MPNNSLKRINSIDFQTIAEDAPVTLWLTNTEGENIFTNNKYKNFIGKERVEKMGGKAWFDALHPDDRQYCLDVFKDAFETHKAFTMEYRLQRRDGEYRHFFDQGEPYIDSNGSFSGFVGSSTDVTEQKSYEDELEKSHNELTQYNHEMSLINELNSYIQVCGDMDETYPIISYYSEQIFPDGAGALYLFNKSKTLVETVCSWGKEPLRSTEIIMPSDCWALRQGKEHSNFGLDDRVMCKHIEGEHIQYTCEPINAQGELLGIFHFEFKTPHFNDKEENEKYLKSRQRIIKIAADNLALSLVSLKLREALQKQSIRDPLTSLYNRRYMEESIEREVYRCNRDESGLGVIMIDIDHFKKFNDEYGHEAGDLVLVNVAEYINSQFRNSDIVCRYGGEELIVIMPSVEKELLVERAEHLCTGVHKLSLLFDGQKLPSITASFGVAHSKEKIDKGAALIKLADVALYQAKGQGRNQVVVTD